MISRPLPKVRDGDILSLGLVNQMIGRVEYASNLLQLNSLIAGEEISISSSPLGTNINFNKKLAEIYRIIFKQSNNTYAIYSPRSNNFLDILYIPTGIDGRFVCGSRPTQPIDNFVYNQLFLYDGESFSFFNHPDNKLPSPGELANGTTGGKIRKNKIAGSFQTKFPFIYPSGFEFYPYNGYVFDISSKNFSTFNYPSNNTLNTFIEGIYGEFLCGNSDFTDLTFFGWFYNGNQFVNLDSLFQFPIAFSYPYAVSESYVVGFVRVNPTTEGGFIYNIKTQQLQTLYHPNGPITRFLDIFNDETIVGFSGTGNSTIPILYNIKSGSFENIPLISQQSLLIQANAIG